MGLFVLITMSVAGFLTSLIGFEREIKGQAAGLRTHVVIALAASLLMSVSIWAIALAQGIDIKDMSRDITTHYDSARIAAGVVAGIGFLGAGAIIKHGMTIRGLTTATTLYASAAIGMACGAGFVLEAIIGTFVMMTFLSGLFTVEKAIATHSPFVTLIVDKSAPILQAIHDEAIIQQLTIKDIDTETTKTETGGHDVLHVKVTFAFRSDKGSINDFVDSFASDPHVFSIQANTHEGKK